MAAQAVIAGSVFAQDYPSRPIRYIVPYSAGGSTTFTARLVGQRLTEVWAQQVIVDNRPGADTMIGTEIGVRAKPDGYTLMYIGSVLAANQVLLKPPYDARRDIAPIATIASFENLLAVHPSVPVKTLSEFIALAKARPGELNYATSSRGGSTHLAVELINTVAGIKTQPIPYKGGGPAVADVVGGQVQFIMAVPVNIVAHVKGGRLRAIAVAGEARLAALPDVPTFTEAGLPGISMPTWHGIGAPSGTPKVIISRISREVEKFVAMPETRKQLDSQGFVPYYNNPDQTAALIANEFVRVAKVVKDAHIKVE